MAANVRFMQDDITELDLMGVTGYTSDRPMDGFDSYRLSADRVIGC